MKKEKPYLFCKGCKKYPKNVTEKYPYPVEEYRQWNGDCYEIVDSNMDMHESIMTCGSCGSELDDVS